MKRKQIFGIATLFLTAIIWGLSFVAQSVGMEKIEAFTFSAIRQLMGGAALLIFIFVRDTIKRKKMTLEEKKQARKEDIDVIKKGLILGVAFFAATNLQQFAFITEKSSGKIAFITAFYMFFAAIFGLFFGKKIPWLRWVGLCLGILGLYFLCINPETGFGGLVTGDFLSLGCSVFFAIQILLIEKFAPGCDSIKLSVVEFIFSGIVSLILMFIFESPDPANIKAVMGALIYSGIFSCGIAYTLQIVGQKYTEATIASLIMCLESVFAAISEAIIQHHYLTPREICGCVIMFGAIVLAELAEKINFKKKGQKNHGKD